MSHKQKSAPRIGLALGSGSSRGWAHIGVIKALSELDIHPQVVCGCSTGSIVAALRAGQTPAARPIVTAEASARTA